MAHLEHGSQGLFWRARSRDARREAAVGAPVGCFRAAEVGAGKGRNPGSDPERRERQRSRLSRPGPVFFPSVDSLCCEGPHGVA